MSTFAAELITGDYAEIKEVKALYRAAFPKNERIPLRLLFWRARRKGIDFIKFSEGNRLVGIAYTIQHRDLLYVLYLAVSIEMQSKGYGSRMLRSIENAHPKSRLALEIEDPEQPAENTEQRVRRKAFYAKNGYASVGFKTREGTVIYEMLGKNGECSVSEFSALMKHWSGTLLYLFFRPRLAV